MGFRVGDPRLESSGSRLASTVYVKQDSLEQAIVCAEYAVKRVAGTAAGEAYIDAIEQQAYVQARLRRHDDAAKSYYEAYSSRGANPSAASRFLLLYLRQISLAKPYQEGVKRIAQCENAGFEHLPGARKTSRDENLVDIPELHLEAAYDRLDSSSAAVFFGELLKATAALPSDRTAALCLLASTAQPNCHPCTAGLAVG